MYNIKNTNANNINDYIQLTAISAAKAYIYALFFPADHNNS
jgi:hypothetical protein